MSFKFPTQPKRREKASVLENLVYQVHLIYYRYEVTFSAYVLTPGEKIVLNSIVLFLFGLIFTGIVSYLPPLLTRGLVNILWLRAGHKEQIVIPRNTTIWNEMPIGVHSTGKSRYSSSSHYLGVAEEVSPPRNCPRAIFDVTPRLPCLRRSPARIASSPSIIYRLLLTFHQLQ
jgi:hypothetical protein